MNKKILMSLIAIMFITITACYAEIVTKKDSFDGSVILSSVAILNPEPGADYPRQARVLLDKKMMINQSGYEIEHLIFIGTIAADNEIKSLTYDIQVNHNPKLILNLYKSNTAFKCVYNIDIQQYFATTGGALRGEYSDIALFLSASSATIRITATTVTGQQIRCIYELPKDVLEEWKQIINTKRTLVS